MCGACDWSDADVQAYVEHVRGVAERERFAVQQVFGSVDEAEFSYTVGLTAHGLPELIVIGMRQETADRLLRSWGSYLLDDSLILPGETLHSGALMMAAVEVERPQDHLGIATRLYGGSVRGLQLVWADQRGCWPWQQEHPARAAGQVLLGQRAPGFCDEHRPDRLDVPAYLE